MRTALTAGVDWIQIREKGLPAKRLLALTREAVRLASSLAPTARIIVNARLDVALAAGAAGVHLGRESLPLGAAIQWRRGGNVPEGFLVGVSCHSLGEAKAAEFTDADYAFFGPIFDTPSKRMFGPPQGIEHLAAVCRSVSLPVIAIGGINESNAVDCVHAGARGIAAIRLFQDEGDNAALRDVISAIHACR